ncbi:MAG: DUF3299 domain-containing protein [Rickettsiales bacterium]|nr:MAG: DUF3299 domain-containing protein [Rickettsiales bacterium]
MSSVFATEYQKIKWEDLIVDENKAVKQQLDKIDWDNLDEDDDRTQKKIQKILDNAPISTKFSGKAVEIVGWIVPLDYSEKGFSEFFLVPYFGACIHSPPPPANQIIYVKSGKKIDNKTLEYEVHVKGILQIEKKKTEMGVGGYKIKMDEIKKKII